MAPPAFSPAFTDKVTRIFGAAGREWLGRLPNILTQCRAKWNLTAAQPCPVPAMNYIEFATTPSGESVALKIGVPHTELFTEMETLRIYDGRRSVRLLDADASLGAMLLQRVSPGTMLWQCGDNGEQTRVAASVIRELHVAVPLSHGLPTFAQWVERAFRLTRTEWDPQGRMPRELIDQAEAVFKHIQDSKSADVVLHGDLHHENILLDGRHGWIAIDPKGAVGAPCLEVGRFLQNQLPVDCGPDRTREILSERVRVFSEELGHPQSLIAAAGLVDCVLSTCWGLEDDATGPGWERGIETARVLEGMVLERSSGE